MNQCKLLIVALLLIPACPILAQDLGHEYEFDAAPIREGEKPVIPLDTEDPSYNIWRQLRDLRKDPKREPGIINVQKYEFGMSYNAMPTFFNQPIAMSPADLKASNVDVAIIGAVPDMGTGARGTAHGPNAVRNSHIYGGYGARQPHMHTMVDPMKDMVVADFGNAPIDIMSMERSVHAIRSFVRSAAEVKIDSGENVIPIIVGGDHSLMYPDVAALTDVYGKGNVGVIHFDAHYDAGKYMMGHLIGHGMPVYRLIEEGLVAGENFIQVALRGYYPDEESFKWMREQGFRYHTMAEIERRGFPAVMEDVIKEAQDGPEYLFVSFDIDTLDPAFVPGSLPHRSPPVRRIQRGRLRTGGTGPADGSDLRFRDERQPADPRVHDRNRHAQEGYNRGTLPERTDCRRRAGLIDYLRERMNSLLR
jgi:agmatinase